jgi:predicted amidohydrolase YtcJ
MEHLTVLRDDQIQTMNSLGVIASIQLTWLTSEWQVLDELNEIEATLGPERIGWAGRWHDLIAQGVTTTGGTDTPWTAATPMQAVQQAVTRVGHSERPASDWMLAQALTVAESLRLLTAGGAYATFQERDKGSLEVGKLADLVVLSANPLNVPVTRIADIEVVVTMVGGRTQFCSSEIGGLPRARCVV